MDFDRQRLILRYEDGEETNEYGILWQREGIARGGEPQYSQVSTPRQRAAMRKCLCQVCGKKIEGRPIRWLMHPDQFDETTNTTMNPPTCEDCIPVALDNCPQLKKAGFRIAKVVEYKPWGVHGGVVWVEDDLKVQRRGSVSFPYAATMHSTAALMAQQEIVEFTKFTWEDRS